MTEAGSYGSGASRLALVNELCKSVTPIFIHPRELIVVWMHRGVPTGVHGNVVIVCMRQNLAGWFYLWGWDAESDGFSMGASGFRWWYPAAKLERRIETDRAMPPSARHKRKHLVAFANAVTDYAIEEAGA